MTTRGERLRVYLLSKTGSRRGWQAGLVQRSGVKRQTITKWTSPAFDGYPDLETLAAVAEALGVRLSELVAAIEGEQPQDALDEPTRALVRAEVEAALAERLGPRRASRE